MKTLASLAIVAALVMTATPSYAGWYDEVNNWTRNNKPLDKHIHISAGAGITYILKKNGTNSALAVAVPVTIGFLKESSDKNFSPSDLLSWIAGGIIGIVLENPSNTIKVGPCENNPGFNFFIYF